MNHAWSPNDFIMCFLFGMKLNVLLMMIYTTLKAPLLKYPKC